MEKHTFLGCRGLRCSWLGRAAKLALCKTNSHLSTSHLQLEGKEEGEVRGSEMSVDRQSSEAGGLSVRCLGVLRG